MTKLKTVKLRGFRFTGATEYTESDKIWRVNVNRGLLKHAKFGVVTKGVGTGAPRISNIGHFYMVMCGYT